MLASEVRLCLTGLSAALAWAEGAIKQMNYNVKNDRARSHLVCRPQTVVLGYGTVSSTCPSCEGISTEDHDKAPRMMTNCQG